MCGIHGVLRWLLLGFEICDPRGDYFTLPLMLQISQDILADPKIVEFGLNGRNDIVNDLTVHNRLKDSLLSDCTTTMKAG